MIRRMRFACWIPKATNILSEYVILIVFTANVVTRTRLYYMIRTLPVLLYLQYLVMF